ncbi:MAG: hypothetical protein J7J11_04865 [Desulfurococcales archaeon]|nr:hypothetical protein [Desulfurococcales archaeon]
MVVATHSGGTVCCLCFGCDYLSIRELFCNIHSRSIIGSAIPRVNYVEIDLYNIFMSGEFK